MLIYAARRMSTYTALTYAYYNSGYMTINIRVTTSEKPTETSGKDILIYPRYFHISLTLQDNDII